MENNIFKMGKEYVLEFSEEEKEMYDNMDKQSQEMFDKMALSATLGIFRGIDMDLYLETTNEMRNFLHDFQSTLVGTDFSNNDLKILKSFLQQGRKVIDDIKKEK